ncbi:PDZ and LIM domain protein Zasp isoform X1 [Anastrepha obliqua]|uniref:PDZ and LIM domain protein Zasp isoform X1 n=1 Tax=Anastrepha obliqua TaxID=95512 RepID=UPI002409A06B|nr:PDZ and LIM domain protein Zasp isoform X1 [Anastrepha obliqua]XP_054738951.1 PDZ and LIM domain protein Zasp isoform X1 [Anastrepha obliqua]XP_054738953.1 PDZ and LIM domain protein Zasp isoform X1 [Anastrepha obliqua]
MAQPQLLQIKLSRFDAQPWGFRLQGGVDFATPLVVQKVNGGSLAESAGLIPGDAVLKINDVDVYNLRHKEAQDVVVRSGNNFVLTVQRGGSTWRPHIAPTGNLPQPQQNSPYLQTVTKTSLAHKQQEGQHIGCGYNNAARPFANGGDGSVKSIVNKQYNTPVGIYSDESIAETLSAQAEVLAGGVLGVNFKKNEKEYQADKSEVLKFLREEETGHSTPAPHQDHQHHQQHHHQQQQQQLPPQQQQHYQPSATRHVSAPVNAPKPPSTGGLPTGQNICHECERLITGVFVRIKDKNLHVECFKCATCGTSLKNQGYYNFNNKLYCDIHAKLAAMQHPPSGTDGYVPVPIKPNTKLSANTISSALNAHGFSDIPYSNGGSAKPSPVPGAQLHEWTDANKEDNTDLPLPPPPSPTLLQQLEIDSQCRGYIDDNTTDTKQQLQHTRTNSSSLSTLSNTSNSPSMSSEAHSIHNLAIVEGIEGTPPTSMAGSAVAVDEKSSGYASTTSLHSRQTSSSSSSVCGISRDADISSLSSPPPPPPLPPSLPIQMIQQPHRQQNENDMNSQNQYGNGGGLAGSGVGSKNSPSGGVYSKFLKEYSNKLLTHSNNNKTQTNPLFLDNSPNNSFNSKNSNKTIVTNNSQNRLNDTAPPYQPTTQISAVAHPQSIQNLNSTSTTTAAVAVTSSATATAAATAKSKTTHPSVVAAIATTPPNLLNFNPCQQVAKAATASATSPPAVSLPPPTTTAISAIINNATSLDTANSNSSSNSKSSNRCEGGQLSESENTHDTAKEITSAMLANQSSALDDSLNDQPFGEYVTLTGSVIRSVVPPGKGVNINYKVNQGYARPFGAASGPPAAAPKSPVSYAPQRPAVNPYATLPRTNIGQQELCTKPTNANATLPHNVNSKSNRTVSDAHQIDTNLQAGGDATAMLTESIGRINMGDKMDNFMAEAGKIISNMLEARLASNGNTLKTSSHGGSTSSLRSNCSSNPSRSPMVIRKRFDLDDFKNVDPTEPVSLKPVLAVQQPPPVELSSTISQKAESPISIRDKNVTQPIDLPKSHPMGKVLDLCDNNKPVCTSTTKNFDVDLKTNDTGVSSIMPTPLGANSANSNCDDNCQLTTNQPQTVVYREKASGPRNSGSSQRNGEMSFHAMDRRSYIEPNDLNVSDSARDGPAFSINVRALGPKSEINEQPSNTVMTPENEQVVSQLLKDGKRPICCQCNTEITKGPFITALGRIWCPEHFICVNANCRRALQDIGFVEEKGDLYCEYCFEKYLAPTCSKCGGKIKGDCLNAIGKQFHPECFTCGHCGKLFGNTPFFLEDGNAYCEADWNELFTTKCFACGFPVEAGDRWVEALNHNYHSQCFNCTYCKQNLEGQSFYNKGGRPFCKNHAR